MDRQRERECLGRNPPRDASSSAPASPNALGADLKEPWAEAGQGRKRRVSECGAPGKAARRLNRELDPPKGRPRPGPAPPEARPGRGARLPPRPSPGQARLPPRPGPDGGPGAPQGPTWTVGPAPPEARPGQWAQLGPRPDPGQARLPPRPSPDSGARLPPRPGPDSGPGSPQGPAPPEARLPPRVDPGQARLPPRPSPDGGLPTWAAPGIPWCWAVPGVTGQSWQEAREETPNPAVPPCSLYALCVCITVSTSHLPTYPVAYLLSIF